ncbi:hypothetical protein PDIG_18170 [Penicillium digitatum PHI26]|uniref:Uncharacterized protein n=2 Tax=Penicillium digitatum TaxID=36651 RepID=K9GV03_PEND2|nr:hypothetical protein PDIP_56010 [Penicillium digitatum Pd1]EKV11500.1 hypothetical protein PDIP_56010 [Penicillium digitatum Pd1]EKV16901.1 hypothetical protein PDIG_18170 [Penicillium digitatum PHI26]
MSLFSIQGPSKYNLVELPFRNWYLNCLHISIAEYDPQENKPFQVNCATTEDGKDSSRGRCKERKITCKTPSIGMLGDVYDFCAILEWASDFGVRCIDLYWNLASRLAVCEATK